MYKIGELAEISKVSKRTIDYYTKIGLLNCVRSNSNYRYYNKEAIEDLKFIEQCKEMHMTLDEVKNRLEVAKGKQVDQNLLLKQVEQMKKEMEHLQLEIQQINHVIEKLDDTTKKVVSEKLATQKLNLIQSLKLFLG